MDVIRPLQVLGIGLLGAAALLGVAALRHMSVLAAYGPICGASPAHCAACGAAIAASVLGAGALMLAASQSWVPNRAESPSRSRSR